MDSTGVTRQARLKTRSAAGDPITLDLALVMRLFGEGKLTGNKDTSEAATREES